MSESSTSFLLQQLLYQAPAFLVYLVGAILGLAYLSRYRSAAALTLLATGLMLLTGLGVAAAQAWLLHVRESQEWGMQQYGIAMGVLSFGGSLVRALALALLLAAVFAGRQSPPPKGEFKGPKSI